MADQKPQGHYIYLSVDCSHLTLAERESLYNSLLKLANCVGTASPHSEWHFTAFATSDLIVDLSIQSGVKKLEIIEKEAATK